MNEPRGDDPNFAEELRMSGTSWIDGGGIGVGFRENTGAWHCHGYRQFWRYVWDKATGEWICSGCSEPMFARAGGRAS